MLNRNRKTGERVLVENRLGASSQNPANYFTAGVVSVHSPPPAPAHMVQNLHHFDIPLLFNFVSPQCTAYCVCVGFLLLSNSTETLKSHATQCGVERSGPLGVSLDWRKGLQPAPDHLQGE